MSIRKIVAVAAVLVTAAAPALAQSVNIDLGGEASTTSRIIQLVPLLTVLSIAPSLLVMVTSFTPIVVVLSFLRTALGTPQAPPTQGMISPPLFPPALFTPP